MRDKILLAIMVLVMFTGCAVDVATLKDGYQVAKTTYKDVKIVYQDAKHIVYEIQQEKDRVDLEGLGEPK
jgi:uncharacterized protein YceK